MKQTMRRRLMLAFATFTLGVSALFGLFAMVFVYSVEDRFLERLLTQEVSMQKAYFLVNGTWASPSSKFITLHTSFATLPDEIGKELSDAPMRREFFGKQERHYHIAPLEKRGEPPLLVAEVSELLVVRPMRQELLKWLVGWGVGMVVLAIALAWWLARRTSLPLEALVQRLNGVDPKHLPAKILEQGRDDEIGALARGLDALMERTRTFIEREQLFTGDVSHELRTPLAVMRMAIEQLQAGQSTQVYSQDLRHQLDAMHTSTMLMEQTVNTLLLLAREKTNEPIPSVLLLPIIEKWTLANEVWLDREQVTIELELTEKSKIALPPAVAQLVIASLLGNAVAHGAFGGVILVRVDENALTITNASAGASFEPSQHSTKSSSDMLRGFGISIVQRLLERHSGTLIMSHETGQTTVRVSIAE
jgi:signal transduction histidine kinase